MSTTIVPQCETIAAPQFRDKIKIEDLMLQVIVGVNKKERHRKQNININITMVHDVTMAGRHDDVKHTINYSSVCKAVEAYANDSHHYTLESLALNIGKICCLNFNAYEVKVKIDKPCVLALARAPSVTIRRTRQFFVEEDKLAPQTASGTSTSASSATTAPFPSSTSSASLSNAPQTSGCVLPLNDWLSRIKASPTHAVKATADEIKKSGATVYDFGIGEMNPFIPVPVSLRKYISEALLDDKLSCYSSPAGYAPVLEALSEDFKLFNHNFSPKQIVVCPGPKDAIFKACVALVNPQSRRKRFLTFAPSYEAFENLPVLVSGEPAIILPTDDSFLPDPKRLDETLRTDPTIAVVIIASPNNPTGVVYPQWLLKQLADVIKQYPEVAVISDEVYRLVMFDPYGSSEKKVSPEWIKRNYVSVAHFIPEQTLVVTGISKECSGTGLRMGWVAGPERVARVIENIEGQITSCVNLPLQVGVAKFLREDSTLAVRNDIRQQLEKRRDTVLRQFSSLPNLKKCFDASVIPMGAFYFFPNVTPFLNKAVPQSGEPASVIRTDTDLALYLLKDAKVVTIPGSAFLRHNHLRLAYARDEDEIVRGLQAMDAALGRLLPIDA